MIRLRIFQEEDGFITRVMLYAKDRHGQIARPVWSEEDRTFKLETMTKEERQELYGVASHRSPMQILEVSGRMGEDDGAGMIQDLLDDLWRSGYRPSKAEDRTDAIKAKDAHIEDLNEARKAVEGFMGKLLDGGSDQ